jgi:tRNA(adenine34) deaminase
MRRHPKKEIMSDLIKKQWEMHSIYAAVVDNELKVVGEGKTTVVAASDPTAHAEINAIRHACKVLRTDKLPQGYWLYSTFEPCPLCASAAVWAGIDGIVYANNPKYRGEEDNWSFISCEEVLARGKDPHKVNLIKDYMIDDIKGYFTRHNNVTKND